MQIAINQLRNEKYLIFVNNKELMENEKFRLLMEQSRNIISPYIDDLYANRQNPHLEKIKLKYSKKELKQKLESDGYLIF